jgi:hypothetical protein
MEEAAALGVVISLWVALARNDDDAVRRLVVPDALLRAEVTQPGCADRYREILGKSRRDCKRMEVLPYLVPAENGPPDIPCLLVTSLLKSLGPGPALPTVLLVAQMETGWLVVGPMNHQPNPIVLGRIIETPQARPN